MSKRQHNNNAYEDGAYDDDDNEQHIHMNTNDPRVKKLLQAMDDDSNEHLYNLTTSKIKDMNMKVLGELSLSKKEMQEYLNKLKGYKYIDEMNELKNGTYVRWISLIDPENIFLTKGAIFCDTQITDDGVMLICKNFGMYNKHFQIKMDESLIFRKLTDQEMILLSALDHLSK
jgi:hypothetical protein